MIEINTAIDSLKDTGRSPYEEASDVQANPEEYGDPYDDMVGLLRKINTNIMRLTDTTERQRSTPGFSEATIGITFPNTVAYRPVYLIFTVSAATIVTLSYGASVQRIFNIPSADTLVIPWTLQIPRGTDVAITAVAAEVKGWFIGYPE